MFISLLVWYMTEIDTSQSSKKFPVVGYFWEDMVLSIHYKFAPIFLLTNGFTLALATFQTKENGNLAVEGVHSIHYKLLFRCVI